MSVQFVDIAWRGKRVRIEHAWLGAPEGRDARDASDAGTPTLVFLHEGLGSRAAWKDFPERLCMAAGMRGLVYSRPGYGKSTPRDPGDAWDVDFLHRQAHEVLPALREALGLKAPLWLFGHSDGGSIALLHAARFRDAVAGLVVVAPHILVEDLSVRSIAEARSAYLETDMRQRMAKYHDNPDSAFWGWNDIWLHPPFRDWSIEDEIASIDCPVLAIQGIDDQYGTLEQIRGIARRVPQTALLELAECGHAVHKDQPDALIAATTTFVHEHLSTPSSIPQETPR